MKTLKTFTSATWAAVAATLLFVTSITRADDYNRSNGNRHDAKATFSKWIIGNGPNMEGVVGGDVGRGTFAGEILKFSVVSVGGSVPVQKLEAIYEFHGAKYSFTALVHVEQTGNTIGSKAVIIGVVTDGWRKGHAVTGKYTQRSFIYNGVATPYFEGTLEIEGDTID